MVPISPAPVGRGGGGAGLGLAQPDPFGHRGAPTDVDTVPEGRVADGRRARGHRTRLNVAEALMELLRAGDPDPTAKVVASQAGVSLRLVFHHFTDMDDLYHFVAVLQLRRQWSDLPRLSPRLSLATRIERTVSHRAALFEEISPVRRALVRRVPSSLGVSRGLRAADGLLLENLKATFAPELAVSADLQSEYLGALDTASSWETWERLRTTSGNPVRAAKRVMAHMLTSLAAMWAAGDVAPAASMTPAPPSAS